MANTAYGTQRLMWVLLISLYMNSAIQGQTQSKGVLHAPQSSYDQCLKQRDQVQRTWQLDQYRISARCVYVRHYSVNNGAYNESDK